MEQVEILNLKAFKKDATKSYEHLYLITKDEKDVEVTFNFDEEKKELEIIIKE